jgi:hypothetical protein
MIYDFVSPLATSKTEFVAVLSWRGITDFLVGVTDARSMAESLKFKLVQLVHFKAGSLATLKG